jgi:mRNA-degrading endonuclease toxin of MazEF toxin-antitoxin module
MNYSRNFDAWNEEKKSLDAQNLPIRHPKVRYIWYVKLGVNVGFESDGKKKFKRPVLVLAKIGSLYWVVPLTSKLKENAFHYSLKSVSFDDVKNSVVMLSQARVIDVSRFSHEIGRVEKEEFKKIQKKMKSLYFPSFS